MSCAYPFAAQAKAPPKQETRIDVAEQRTNFGEQTPFIGKQEMAGSQSIGSEPDAKVKGIRSMGYKEIIARNNLLAVFLWTWMTIPALPKVTVRQPIAKVRRVRTNIP